MPPSSDVPSLAPDSTPEVVVEGDATPAATSPNGVVELPATGTGIRRRLRRQRKQRLTKVAFGLSLVMLLLSIPALGYVGYRAVFNSTAGRRINLPTDPSKEGYEATVTATPTDLFLVTDAKGALAGAAVASLATDQTGTVTGGNLLLLPVATFAPPPPAPDAQTLATVWSKGGQASVERAVTMLFGLAFDEVVIIDHARWASLVAPVAPITIDNPDRITEAGANGRTKTVFASGPLHLAASDVATYFEARSPKESELSRLARQQRLWDAWLAAVRTSADVTSAVPGEVDSGIGRYVRALATGKLGLSQLPVLPPAAVDAGTDKEAFTADTGATARLVASIVPYPTGGPDGGRVRVRLLDGVRQPGLTALVAPLLVPDGAEITIAGNADRFTYDTTQVVYYDEAFKDAADRFRDALGAGQVVLSNVPNDTNDITVVIGRDFVNIGPSTTVTTGGSGG
ncbi:MAG: hypothetical protein QOG39_1452 [Acidimicrobiaceae bacterium]